MKHKISQLLLLYLAKHKQHTYTNMNVYRAHL